MCDLQQEKANKRHVDEKVNGRLLKVERFLELSGWEDDNKKFNQSQNDVWCAATDNPADSLH